MIQLNCTHCQALLQIDDAFAGGVCRCRHCGTIQTVPKHLKNSNGDAAAAAAAEAEAAIGGSKSLYQRKGGAAIDAGSGTGLDDLAGIVASSGLSSKRLQKSQTASRPAAARKPKPKDNKTLVILSVAGAVIALLLGIIIFMAVRDKSAGDGIAQNDNNQTGSGTGSGTSTGNPAKTTATGGTNNVTPPPPRTRVPNFLGQPLTDPTVAFVLDHGQASLNDGRLDLMKRALISSLRSLRPDQKFAVMFWQLDEKKPEAWPKSGLESPTPENIEKVQKFLDDVYGAGQTHKSAALELALKSGAQTIVVVPIKTFLNDNFYTTTMNTRGQSTAKIHCISLQQPDLAPHLKKVADATNGAYRDVPLQDLQAAGDQ
jgi:hypothetical protein